MSVDEILSPFVWVSDKLRGCSLFPEPDVRFLHAYLEGIGLLAEGGLIHAWSWSIFSKDWIPSNVSLYSIHDPDQS